MRIRLSIALALLALGLILPATGHAAVRCSVEEGGLAGPTGDALAISTTAFADAVAVQRNGDRIVVSDDLRVKRVGCGGPTVSSIDSIELATQQEETSLYLDLVGGLFRPGASPEDEPWSEIEIEIEWPFGFLGIGGRPRDDVLRFGEVAGDSVADLNGDGDVDVDANVLGSLIVRGRHGNDVLDASGGRVVSFQSPSFAPLTTSANIEGGSGDDAIYGGAARDFISAGGGDDLVEARDGLRDEVDCGAGRDRVDADERDRLRDCERHGR